MRRQSVDQNQKHPIKQAIHKPVTLKQLANHLGLDPATVSVVLNDVEGRSIPQVTRDRIKATAKEMNYERSFTRSGIAQSADSHDWHSCARVGRRLSHPGNP